MRLLLFLLLPALSTACFAQSAVRGPIISAVTDSSARAIVQLDGAASVRLEVSSVPDFSGVLVQSEDGNAQKTDNYFVTLDLRGLFASTRYYVRLWINGQPRSAGPPRSFRTFPSVGKDSSYTFVFGSCSRYDSATRPSGVFKLMQQDDPLFFLHLGDWDYPDYEVSPYFSDHDSTIARAYERKYLTNGGMDTLLANCAVDYVYDDHDYIGNNSDGTWRTRDAAVSGYRKYFPHYDLPNPSEGIWHKFSAGNVDVFMLDLRSCRSVDTNAYRLIDTLYVWQARPGQSMLRGVTKGGEDQLSWLFRELRASTARWKFIISSVSWNPGVRKQLPLLLAQANATKSSSMLRTLSDTWLGFTEEQDSILAFVKREGITNVIVCSGDVHTAMMDDGANAVFPEIVSANLQNYNSNVYGQLKKLGLAEQIWDQGGQVNDTLRTYGRITIKTLPRHAALLEIVDESARVVASYEVVDSAAGSAVSSNTRPIAAHQLSYVAEDKRTMTFAIEIATQSMVKLYIVDSMGRMVEQLLKGVLPQGRTNFPIRKGKLASGAYQLILEAGGSWIARSFNVVK